MAVRPFFFITTTAPAKQLADEWAEKYGFEYDRMKTDGRTIVAWALDVDESELEDLLSGDGIEYSVVELDAERFLGR